MSVVRFLHTDALRLGSPVAGLSESPDWLRKVAASAVRTSVTNVIEAAIAGRCQLLVVSGRITELDQDLDLSVTWLAAQTAALKEHGVRLVIAGHPETDFSALRRLDAILVGPHQRLDVWSSSIDRVECVVSSRSTTARPGALGIEVALASSSRPLADLAYVAVPTCQSSTHATSLDAVASAHDRHLRLSAGSPQAINPTERGTFGCQLVEVDLARPAMTARFCPTDVIRFAQELVTCRNGMHASQLCDLLRERSRALATTGRRTTVVEWVIDGHLGVSQAANESLCELDLLKDLRGSVHAGHSGAWPCRIRFSDSSTVSVAGHRSVVAGEFSSVVRDRLARTNHRFVASDSDVISLPLGSGSEAALGLELLRRVA